MCSAHPAGWQHLDCRIPLSPLPDEFLLGFFLIKESHHDLSVLNYFSFRCKWARIKVVWKITFLDTYHHTSKKYNVGFKVEHKEKSSIIGETYLFWLPNTFHYKISLKLGRYDTIIFTAGLQHLQEESPVAKGTIFFSSPMKLFSWFAKETSLGKKNLKICVSFLTCPMMEFWQQARNQGTHHCHSSLQQKHLAITLMFFPRLFWGWNVTFCLCHLIEEFSGCGFACLIPSRQAASLRVSRALPAWARRPLKVPFGDSSWLFTLIVVNC